jgi:hypothetical protein
LRINGISQNLSHLFLHASTMSRSAPLEPYLDFFFDISNNQLGHAFPLPFHDIMISSLAGFSQKYPRSKAWKVLARVAPTDSLELSNPR